MSIPLSVRDIAEYIKSQTGDWLEDKKQELKKYIDKAVVYKCHGCGEIVALRLVRSLWTREESKAYLFLTFKHMNRCPNHEIHAGEYVNLSEELDYNLERIADRRGKTYQETLERSIYNAYYKLSEEEKAEYVSAEDYELLNAVALREGLPFVEAD